MERKKIATEEGGGQLMEIRLWVRELENWGFWEEENQVWQWPSFHLDVDRFFQKLGKNTKKGNYNKLGVTQAVGADKLRRFCQKMAM